MRGIIYCFFSMLLFIMGCKEVVEEDVEILTDVHIDLDSSAFQEVYDFKDRWERDSLAELLSHPDPSFRAFAARLFADIIHPDYINKIGELINDPVLEVRREAAFTLGQSRSEQSIPYLLQVFEQQDSLGVDPLTFKYALEAIGKCGDSTYLALLGDISTYGVQDTLLLEGQMLGMFHLGYRGYSDDNATRKAIQFIGDTIVPSSVRLISANFLVVSSPDLTEYREVVQSAFEEEQDPEIRMFLGQLIGLTGRESAAWIQQQMAQEKDPRVKVQILKGVSYLPAAVRHQILSSALRDPHLWVAQTAGELLLEFGSSHYYETYANWAFSTFPPETYAFILAIGNKFIKNTLYLHMVQDLIFQKINTIHDPFLKQGFIWAAGQNGETAARLLTVSVDENDYVLQSAIIEALVHSVRIQDKISPVIRDYLLDKWESGDVAAVSMVSPLISEFPHLFPRLANDQESWNRVRSKLAIPENIEADIEMAKAISILFDEVYTPGYYETKDVYTQSINWELYNKLADEPRAEIITNRGSIQIKLNKIEAPASVINFINLAESGYYNGKIIHRVVPNFVIQGGGNRGDGYGSMEYTIRSELRGSEFDASGWVGMASAGLHTESQQWFITYRPALHLNGRYTRFGKMIDGWSALMEIKKGDIIKEIQIHR